MSLFFCRWEDRVSLLIDAENETEANKIATEVAEGESPKATCAIPPRAFVCEVNADADEEEGEAFLDPLDHTEAILEALDTKEWKTSRDVFLDTNEPRPAPSCGREADGAEGDTYICTRPDGHDGPCQATNERGVILAEWTSEPADEGEETSP